MLELKGWDGTEVRGADAAGWLDDLVTASVQILPPGETVRSLLLGPTGRIRADVHMARTDRGYLLLQGPGQPDAIAVLLDPYVLSSDITLAPAGLDGLALTPLPGARWAIGIGDSDGARIGVEAF